MPFLLAEILNFQGSTHRIGVGSFSKLFFLKVDRGVKMNNIRRGEEALNEVDAMMHDVVSKAIIDII